MLQFEPQAPANRPRQRPLALLEGRVVQGQENGHHRFRSALDFGFASLDLLYALPDDTGEYTCVATNQYGLAMISTKLACAASRRIITVSQIPQGMNEGGQRRQGSRRSALLVGAAERRRSAEEQVHAFVLHQIATDSGGRERTGAIRIRRPATPSRKSSGTSTARRRCTHRYKLHFDGMHYMTISNARTTDDGEVVVIAKNSEGKAMSTAPLDVFLTRDFRHVQLKPAMLKSGAEMERREQLWQEEMMGTLSARPSSRRRDPTLRNCIGWKGKKDATRTTGN